MVQFSGSTSKNRGVSLATNGSDCKTLQEMLKKLPNVPLETLQDAAISFIQSQNPFWRQQGHPLRYWAANINAFLGREKIQDELKEL